jgi:methylglyoxal synthase
MQSAELNLRSSKNIALVAHDSKKLDLLAWVRFNRDLLAAHNLYATGTTGDLLARGAELEIIKLKSGPWGGDQQIGAKIADGEIDFLIFFWDPLETQAHDTDIKALLRIAVVWNIPVACNRATADFMISSRLMSEDYQRIVPDYQAYVDRRDVASSAPAGPEGSSTE